MENYLIMINTKNKRGTRMNKSEFTALLDACIETQKVTQDFKKECGTLLFNHSNRNDMLNDIILEYKNPQYLAQTAHILGGTSEQLDSDNGIIHNNIKWRNNKNLSEDEVGALSKSLMNRLEHQHHKLTEVTPKEVSLIFVSYSTIHISFLVPLDDIKDVMPKCEYMKTNSYDSTIFDIGYNNVRFTLYATK